MTGFEYITWKDAVSEDPWCHRSEITPHFHTIESVGFLVDESDDVVTLALNHDQDGDNLSCVMHIPKVMIIHRVALEQFIPLIETAIKA